MRRAKLILGVSAVMMAMMIAFAAPAMAEDRDFDRFDNDGFFFFIGDDFDRDDRFDFDFDGDGGLSQDFEQETESGDVDQSFEISGGGDNASQCVNASGVSNTGNVQDVSGFTSFGSDIDEFEQEDIGSELSVDGNSDVTCAQQVNQAAAAG